MGKKIIVIAYLLIFLSCVDNTIPEGCLEPFSVGYSSDLNLPQFNNLVIGNAVELPGGAKGIILFRKTENDYVAFDRICPDNSCNLPMIYEDRLLKCQCNDFLYSLDFGGSPQTIETLCSAIEYRVIVRGTRIQITNF